MHKLYHTELKVDYELPQHGSFPFDTSYMGQNKAIQEIIDNDKCLLCSHTGSGKSSVFLTAAHELNLPTIIIEPRKFLQKQIGDYYNDYCLYGRGNYPCMFAPSSASAPCLKRHKMGKQWYFYFKKKEIMYPCADCEYIKAIHTTNAILNRGGVVVVNFGNFWRWVNSVKFVIIDEMDEFFRSISNGIVLKHSTELSSVEELIQEELYELHRELEDLDIESLDNARIYNKLKSTVERLQFYKSNKDICFAYHKKDWKEKKDKVYVEIQPGKSMILLDRLFSEVKLCGVTATPSEFQE